MRKNMNEIDSLQRQLAKQFDAYVALGRATEEEKMIHGRRLVDALAMLDEIDRALTENRQL